jgi:hypothetical protein
VLRELEGLSYKEIAGGLDVPMGTVMSTLFRGRERFRHTATDLVRRQAQPRAPRPSAPNTRNAETGCRAGASDCVAAGSRDNGRYGAGYCRRRDWLAHDEQAIEMVDGYRSRRASSASAAKPSTSWRNSFV